MLVIAVADSGKDIGMSRARWVAISVVTACGLGSLVGPPGMWIAAERVDGTDRRIAALEAIAASSGRVRRVQVIEEIRRDDSSDSWRALERLSASDDAELAALAISAIGRSGNSRALRRLESVLEDDSRPAAVRALALTAWCQKKADDGASWGDIDDYVDAKCARNSTLEGAASAVREKRFGGGAR